MIGMKIDVHIFLTLVLLKVIIMVGVGCLLLLIGVVKFEKSMRLMVARH
jgi:hypothetical protein